MGRIACQCGRAFTFRPEHAGKVARCPSCSATLLLPNAEVASSPTRPKLKLMDETDEGKLAQPRTPPETAGPLPWQAEQPLESPQVLSSRAEAAARVYLPRPTAPTPPVAIPSFWAALSGAFAYPFKGNGLVAMIIGLLVLTAGHYFGMLLAFFPLIGGLFALALAVVVGGYFAGYLLTIMAQSARGEAEAPDWPDLTDYQATALRPFLFVFALGVLCGAPALLHRYATGGASPTLTLTILAVGLFYMPMGMLCVAMANDIRGLNPVSVVRAIISVPLRYGVAWLLVAAAVMTWVYGANAVGAYLPVPILGTVLQEAVCLYCLFVAARVMGLLYYTAEGRLGWLDE